MENRKMISKSEIILCPKCFKAKMMKKRVRTDDFGITHCECGSEIICNVFGDMPEVCPICGATLDYSNID